jgi:hypothetical protein
VLNRRDFLAGFYNQRVIVEGGEVWPAGARELLPRDWRTGQPETLRHDGCASENDRNAICISAAKLRELEIGCVAAGALYSYIK